VAYLLVHGDLPTRGELDRWVQDITTHTFVHESVKHFMTGFRDNAHPMGMLQASVGALSTFYPESAALDDPDTVYQQVIRIIAKIPTIAAFAYRHSGGRPYVYPDNDLSYVANFLSMMWKMAEPKYAADPRVERAVDVLWILNADHEQNCSTSAVRSVGSSRVDPYSAVSAGIAALHGPRHGGANEAVIKMLRRIQSPTGVPEFLAGVKRGEERLMGFGHRVYKNYDPRAAIIKKSAMDVLDATGENPLLDVAVELERIALQDDYFVSRPALPQRRLLLRADLPGAGHPPRDVHRHVRHPPCQRLDRPVAGDGRRQGTEDHPAAADLRRAAAPRLRRPHRPRLNLRQRGHVHAAPPVHPPPL